MADPKKRSIECVSMENGNDEENCESAASVNTGEPEQKKRRIYEKKQKIRTPSINVWATLPGELKNQIYELVLVKRDAAFPDVGIRFNRRSKKTLAEELPMYYSASNNAALYQPWKMPGLFLVSKQISREAQSIYFSTNSFEILLSDKTISAGISWIKLHLKEAKRVSGVFMAKLFMSNVTHWFEIAKYIFQQPFELPDDIVTADEIVTYWIVMFGVHSRGPFSSSARAAFRQMIKVVVKAQLRGVSYANFLEDYKDWAMMTKELYCRTTGKPFNSKLALEDLASRMDRIEEVEEEMKTS